MAADLLGDDHGDVRLEPERGRLALHVHRRHEHQWRRAVLVELHAALQRLGVDVHSADDRLERRRLEWRDLDIVHDGFVLQ